MNVNPMVYTESDRRRDAELDRIAEAEFSGEEIWEQIAFDASAGGKLEALLSVCQTGIYTDAYLGSQLRKLVAATTQQLREKHIRSNA